MHLCRGLDLGQSLALFESSLLLEAEDLEALKVRQSLPPLDLLTLLGPVRLLPLGVDLGLLPLLLEGGLSCAAVETLNDEVREKGSGQGERLSGNHELGV